MCRLNLPRTIVSLLLATLGACSSNGRENAATIVSDAAASAPSCDAASSEEVSVDNSFGALDGTLTLPERCAAMPPCS